ncbi:MAG: adenylyl-sulfate kinase [Bacteroidota bacterium]|jgi:adenylylsulfate kinase
MKISISKFLKFDRAFKIHIFKSFSWRIIGTIDTAILGWIITNDFKIGLKIGGLELFTKIFLYFLHERLWHKIYKFKKVLSTDLNINQLKKVCNNKIVTIWLTGLPCSGKSTLAKELHSFFNSANLHSYILDGDDVRTNICSDLNYSRDDRRENIRRSAEIAKILNDNGIIVIASFVSPFNDDRLLAMDIIKKENFFQIFVDTDLDICIGRDSKGLYKLAMSGKVDNFTGINDIYEVPTNSNFHIVNNEFLFESLVNSLLLRLNISI